MQKRQLKRNGGYNTDTVAESSSKWSYLMNNVCVYVFKKKHVLRVY